MKIAVHSKVLSEKNLNGIGIYTYNLLKAICEIDKKNEYVLYSNQPIIHKINNDNFSEKILNFPKLWTYLRLPFEFIYKKYDLLFIPSEKIPFGKRPNTVIVCYDLGLLIKTCHSMTAKIHFWLAINYALRSADKIIAVSEFTKKDIIEKCNITPDNVIVTLLGYDKDIYNSCYDEELICKVKKKYGIKDNYILNLSSLLWYRKNLPRIIKAFYKCKSKGVINHQLVITGDRGEAYDEIVALINSLGIGREVILIGYVQKEDIPILLSGADALVFTSLYEGFGLPVLEAMACGCPVITSNCSAMPEVAQDAGILVDPYNEDEIAYALEKVIGDANLRNSMRQKGLERAKMFSWEKTARKTLEVFESLVER